MPDYRIYFVGRHAFVDALEIECADDAEATAKAQQMGDGHNVELWQSSRRIGVFRHDTTKK